MKRIFICCAIFLALFLSSCDLDDDTVNFHFTSLQAVSANVPDSFDLNETYEIEVTYLRPDECTFFEGFDVNRTETTTRNVVVIGSVLTDQDECAEVSQEITASFRFQVIYPETYLFRFWTGTDENGEERYLEIEVPVNP
ncbi:hypothetical protein [Costertonia aggregata]|uniref:Lipoprotein n=1 Tax=Costertonia aggregata TaxID=343403 RepID=A0A7H9APZ1_9FLAO|nr:hypothetical protein [Costertonia aggregata]QLG45315.1 hypothetical protein HYG79_08125 [Costertonia aggregata]